MNRLQIVDNMEGMNAWKRMWYVKNNDIKIIIRSVQDFERLLYSNFPFQFEISPTTIAQIRNNPHFVRRYVVEVCLSGTVVLNSKHASVKSIELYDLLRRRSIAPLFTSSDLQPSTYKDMEIYKSKKITIGDVRREITIAVTSIKGKLRAGYSIRILGDRKIDGLSEKIALGRAMKDSTNLIDMELGKGMDKKYILYSIADSLLVQIERGVIEIKGIRSTKIIS